MNNHADCDDRHGDLLALLSVANRLSSGRDNHADCDGGHVDLLAALLVVHVVTLSREQHVECEGKHGEFVGTPLGSPRGILEQGNPGEFGR